MQGTKRAKLKAIELSDSEYGLQSRLVAFGFVVPDDVIRGWTDEQDDVLACLDQWELDRRIVARGEAIDARERTPVPEFLKGFEQVTPQQIITASEQGKKAAEDIDQTSEHNPYPIDTALAAAWDDALANNVIKPDETPKPVAKIEHAQQQRAVIEDLQAQIEATLIHQREVRQEQGQWWVKEIDGFGPETITKLQDAQEIVRRKFPVPSPDEPVTLRITGYSPGAIERIGDLIDLCEEVIENDKSEDQNATSFCESVAQQAAGMRDRIAKGEELSAAMEAAIENWETAVEKWREGQN